MKENFLTAKTPEAYFRNLLESAPDAMIFTTFDGEIVLINGQAEQMFGYGRDELQGEMIEILIPARLKDRHQKHRGKYRQNPELRPMGPQLDLLARRKDGSEFPVEISLSPVESPDGSVVSAVIRDVTDRKRLELELVAARQEAERANKANSAFLAAASHDLRQPVQALTLLNGALRRTVKDERSLEMIRSQEHSLTAMTNLLNSLLDIGRLDAGAITPEFEIFPVQRLIDRFSAEFGRQATQKGLTFEAHDCDALIRSDPNLLAEILQNFVSNAIRYTDKGSVKLDCARDGDYVRLSVVDTGIGIEPDQLDAIFREFHQCRVKGSSNEGFGLGLAIVKRMAHLLEHNVSVESTPGSGSTFSITVPVPAADADVSHLVDEEPDDEPMERGVGLIVLIEDDVDVANAWAALLEAEGYRVATAASASEANALAHHLDTLPSLIISDFQLLDGST
ncbi:MAG: PAS domain S-box protein, partial [Woeseiaceae bacterium]|nr:PAS domain S-box protein [Woeseiaceae bacterium]